MHADVLTCPHGERCGGCDHLGVPYADQLAQKRRRLELAVAPYDALTRLTVEPTRPAEPLGGYRTRLKWMAGRRGALGLFARGSHEVVDTPACAVAAPGLLAIGEALRDLLRAPTWSRIARSLRAVDLREVRDAAGAAQALVTLVLVREERPPRKDLEAFAGALREVRAEVVTVAANWAAKRAIQVLGDETEILVGEATAPDHQGDVDVSAAPGGFVQVHRPQAAAMVRELLARAEELRTTAPGKPRRVLELFAGAGPIGLSFARAGWGVTAVESFSPAVAGLRAAAAAQALSVEAIAGDAEAVVARLVRDRARFDLVIVDPPRRGLSPALRRGIAALAPRAVGYVSCDPDTLARDLADLAWHGLSARAFTPWDFLPLTEHVETVAWLQAGAPRALEVLARGPSVALVDAPAHATPAELAGRIAATLGAGFTAAAAPGGGSGVVVVTSGEVEMGRTVATVAVRGVVTGRPRGVRASCAVVVRGSGRSLLRLEVEDGATLGAALDALGRAGHPVLGDPRDPPTARHVLERYGVDRPLAHVTHREVRQGETSLEGESPFAGDFSAALTRLGLAPT